MSDEKVLYDVVIIGGGPAGLSAALYLSRAKYRVLVLEKGQFGGQITITHEVVNYPGVGICSGKELTDTMYRQAESFGAEFLNAEALSLDLAHDEKVVHTDRGSFSCLGILLATGAHPRKVGFLGEEEYKGRGVAYCATCDGEFFTGKEVFVIGGGYAAAQESVFLTKFASHVTVFIRKEDFSCAEAVAEQARNHEKITIVPNTEVEEVRGKAGLDYLRYRNRITGETTEYHAKEGENFGLFVFAGYAPETELVKDLAELDEQGYIITDKSQKTSVDGLYAAGDICVKPLRQVITAASDGALAATELEKYTAMVQRRTGLRTKDPVIRKEVQVEKESKDTDQDVLPQEVRAQVKDLFFRLEHPLVLKVYPDEQVLSKELKAYVTALTKLSDKLSMEIDKNSEEKFTPCVRMFRDGKDTGLAFFGVPGGHEFTSFLLGIYNVAGPGQPIDAATKERIEAIDKRVDIKVLVTLSCSMCPDLVIAAMHLAAKNDNVTAEIFDIHHYPDLQKQYQVMSVPCMVLNDRHVFFGKRSMQQLLDLIEAVLREKSGDGED